jgi:plastocyanin
MSSRLPQRFLFAALMVGNAVLSPASAIGQTTVTVDVVDFDFVNPSTGLHFDPVITVGDTVRWNWVNGVHSTTAALGQADFWDSGTPTTPPFTFDHQFNIGGTFNYYCKVHGFDLGGGMVAGMSGFVRVNPVPEPTLLLLTAGVFGTLAFGRRRGSAPLATAPAPPVND